MSPNPSIRMFLLAGWWAAAPAATPPVIRNLAYLEAGRKERLDLYLPERRPGDGASPAAIYIHGGGWISGDKNEGRAANICQTLAQAGFVCASIDYRLGDGAWPTNLLDCKNGVRFLRSRASRYRIDPDRLAVVGASAGGHLALMVGFTAGLANLEPSAPYPGLSSAVAAVIDFYGPTEPLAILLPPDAMAAVCRTFRVPFGGSPALQESISPLPFITAAAPPVLVFHGLADPYVPYGQTVSLVSALGAKGVAHELIALAGVGHSFDLQKWNNHPLPRDLGPEALAFLRQSLGRRVPHGRR